MSDRLMAAELASKREKWWQPLLSPHLLTMLVFGSAIALADQIIQFYVFFLDVATPHYIVAGFTEPVSSKLIPAIVVLWASKRRADTLRELTSHPFRHGAFGGFWFGFWERVGYIVIKHATIESLFFAPLLLHTSTGLLVAGGFYWSTRIQGIQRTTIISFVVVVAMAIHILWNGWIVWFLP